MSENDELNQVSNVVNNNIEDLANQILVEEDLDSLKKLVALFNLNQARKNVIRTINLNELYDIATENLFKRVKLAPGEFSNQDMMKLMSVIENSIDRAQKGLGMVDETPAIQFNQQNNVNVVIGGEEFDRESRQRILDAINALSQPQEIAPKDVEE